MQQNPVYTLESLEPPWGPCFAAIERPVHGGHHRDLVVVVVAALCPDPDPQYLGVGLVDGDRGDGRNRLVVENRPPCLAPVDGLPEPTGRRPDVYDVRIRHDRVDRGDPADGTDRADAPRGHLLESVGTHLTQGRLGNRPYDNG